MFSDEDRMILFNMLEQALRQLNLAYQYKAKGERIRALFICYHALCLINIAYIHPLIEKHKLYHIKAQLNNYAYIVASEIQVLHELTAAYIYADKNNLA